MKAILQEPFGPPDVVGLSLFLGAGLLAFIFLVGGLEPAYRLETELAIDDIGERCPSWFGAILR